MVRSVFRWADDRVFGGLRAQLVRRLESEILGDCDSLLDVGCGSDSPLRRFSRRVPRTVGVDLFEGSLEASRAAGIHDEVRRIGALDILDAFGAKAFDAVMALDVIEHFDKDEGLLLLERMEATARKKAVVFTPNGFQPQEVHSGNVLHVHKSGWTAAELRSKGYTVRGINGWKALRGDLARPRWRPAFFWGRVSLLTQLITESRPDGAYALLGVKDLRG